MTKSKIFIEKLTISNPDYSRKFLDTFVFEPKEDLKAERGQIGFLLEMEYKLVPSAEDIVWAKEFSQNLINFIEINYYQLPKSSSDLNKNFENLLQLLNQWLPDQLNDKILISLAIFISQEDNLYFASIGKILVYLYQENKIVPLIESDNKKVDIKFSNIISGTLKINDQIIFATSNLFDYLPKEKIEKLLNNRNVNILFRKIRETIKIVIDKISFGFILIRCQKLDEASKEEFEVLEKEEFKVLEGEKNITSVIPTSTKSKIQIPTLEEFPEELKIKEGANILEQPKSRILSNFSKKVYKLILLLGHILRLDSAISNLKNKLNQFSYFQKTLIILLLIFIILFIQSLINFGRQEYKKQIEQKYTIIVQEIQNIQNEITAALIYKDEKKAKLLLQNLETLLDKLPQQTEAQKQLYNFFKEEFKKQMAKLYYQDYLETPKVLVDLINVDNKIKIAGIAKIGDKIYFFNPNNNFIYQINLVNNKVDLINKSSINIGYLKKIIGFDKDFLLFSHSNNGLAFFNITNKTLSGIELVTDHQNLEIKDITTYLGKLYILDPNNNQIFRYIKTASGFGKEESWLSKPEDLKKAVSIAADGALYVLYEDGQVSKFFRGNKQEFKFSEIYPRLERPIKILTWLDSKYIYILEPINKRLIIFDKNGRLVKQIVSDYFDNLIDFTINEKEDIGWLLNGTKIYEVKLK